MTDYNTLSVLKQLFYQNVKQQKQIIFRQTECVKLLKYLFL